MKLRGLSLKDVSKMTEWLTDNDVTQYLHGDYSKSSEKDAHFFIENASKNEHELHLAIVSDDDEYVGTVSLRHIDYTTKIAEFAIVVRKKYMHRGYAWYAMTAMLDIAFNKLLLEGVYWRVAINNERALSFFKKHEFGLLDNDIPSNIRERHKNEHNLAWFSVLKGDDYKNKALSRKNVAGCPIIKINTIPTIGAGELSFFEALHEIPFEIKRIYHITKVPEGTRRGFHAHKKLQQLLFCPYGKIQLVLEDGCTREEITLDDPSIGVLITKPIWREMLWLENNSVLVVAASEYYDPMDYIRDHDEFKRYIKILNSESL